ncbi:hypothetical protein QBC37DRAFT_428698 [Rhypophila decipiens]|uniref:Uncharacterized protein n=1 Tax=Rhypophila decipiens TaxID=261697 RepID=A0AAN6Y1V0_9PEZI|nr:hypothetical protein QBC37DRAFT_428698 [Rhypophila decipiens]
MSLFGSNVLPPAAGPFSFPPSTTSAFGSSVPRPANSLFGSNVPLPTTSPFASSVLPPTTKVEIDPNGDLTLVIGRKPAQESVLAPGSTIREFLVDSRAVSRGSPVLKRMLNGPFMESKPSDNTEWRVSLPDDIPEAAKVLFDIAHSRFEAVDSLTPSVAYLHAILVFSEKYDMTALLRPWAKSWLPLQRINTWTGFTEFAQLVGITWELGAKDSLDLLVKRMLVECGTGTDDGKLIAHGTHISIDVAETMPLVPPGLFASIAEERNRIIDKMLKEIKQHFQRLHQLAGSISTEPKTYGLFDGSTLTVPKPIPYCTSYEVKTCHTLMLGSLMASFQVAELQCILAQPGDPLTRHPFSIKELEKQIKCIPSTVVGYHSHCKTPGPQIQQSYQETLNAMKSLLTEEHQKYLANQHLKLGGIRTMQGK